MKPCDIIILVLRDKKNKETCGCSSMVEHQPSKLDTWVRFPSPAFFYADGAKTKMELFSSCFLYRKNAEKTD